MMTADHGRSSSVSPTPSARPTSPSADGLSRRLSWGRHEAERPRGRHPSPLIVGSLDAPSQSNLLSHPLEEHDLGRGWAQPSPIVDLSRPYASHSRSFRPEMSFESLEVNSSPDDMQEDDDRERLTPGMTHGPLRSADVTSPNGRRAPPWAGYDPDSSIALPGPSRLVRRSDRLATLRQVSKAIRKASVRVANIMGHDDSGMVRLEDQDDLEDEDLDEKELGEAASATQAGQDERPGPLPPEGKLRGRTLCLFGTETRLRQAMAALLRWSWTEPFILALIIVNVVVLTVQASRALNTPRTDDGYFQSWEDAVLLALFAVFTVEIFARIIVSGLILDPESSVYDYLFSPTGIVTITRHKISRSNPALHLTTSRVQQRKATWRERSDSVGPIKSIPFLPEAPFQRAVERQQGLSAAGRPYLRHSWHRIDLIAVVAFWITFILAISGAEATADRHVFIFRALSVLRVGRLLVITSGTATILRSLKRAGPLLVTVSFFVVFAGVIFSIIGVQVFRGSFRRACILADPNNSTNLITLGQLCGGYVDPDTLANRNYLNLDGSVATIKAKGYICPLGQICQTTDTNPNGDTEGFDNIFLSAVSVVVIASINTWSNNMYSAMDSDFFSSSLYFLVAVIVLNFWLINLLVAVVVNTFKDIRAETRKSAFGAESVTAGTEPHWAANRDRSNETALLRLYRRTELFWVVLVLVDVVAQGTRTSSSSQRHLKILDDLELGFTFAFAFEIIVRLAAYLPQWRTFFVSGRNDFDLFLAIGTLVIQIPVIHRSTAYPWLTVLQLLRWYRFTLAFPRMKPLLALVFGSFAGLLNMVIFLFFINFLGALVAVQLFRGDLSSGDTIDFSQMYNSFLGMYQVFSSENWTTILYAAMSAEFAYTQGWIAAIFFCGWFLFSNFIVLQLFIAVINENFSIAEEQKRQQQMDAYVRKTQPQSAAANWVDRLNPYRFMAARHDAVTVSSLPPTLVLPLKQNVGPDVGAPPALGDSDFDGAKAAISRLLGRRSDEPAYSLKAQRRALSMRVEELDDLLEDDRGLSELLPPLNAGPSADEHLDALREKRNQQADFIAAHPSYDRSLWIFKQSNPVRKFCQMCFHPSGEDRIFGRPTKPLFALAAKVFIFIAIVMSLVIAAIANPEYRRNYYNQHGFRRGTWFDLVEVAFGAVFVVEAVMKIIADGFVFTPNAYLLSFWNIFDFLMLIAILINITTSLIFIGGLSRFTRSLKGFRALRLITLFSRLRDTLHAVLFAGARSLLDASILMMLYIIPFAIWGVNIFAGLLFTCNDGEASGLSSCIGEYVSSAVGDLGFLAPRVWSNPGLASQTTVWAFDSFRESILILFEIISLEGWINVMASVMNIVGRNETAQTNASQWNALFLLIYNLFGGVIILTLFVSIIIGNFSTRSGAALLTSEQRQWVDLTKFIRAQTPSQLPKRQPRTALREWCYARAVEKNGYWARSLTVIYYIHILLLMTEDFSNNVMTDTQLDGVFLGLTVIYAIDLVVRFYGLGFNSFRRNGWNIFDLIVVTGSFATTIPLLRANNAGLPATQVNLRLQRLFLVSVALKLVQRNSALNQLFKTSVSSLPAVGNLFLLWATFFLFFAILFIEVFGLTKIGNNSYSRFQNYYSMGNALVMLAFMSTGEGWNGYMHDYTISFPRCTYDPNVLFSDCGSPSWAFGLFISWNILSMYIFANMFTGVVVESFAYVYQMPGGASLNRDEMRAFKGLWAEFDDERTGYLKRKDFVPFFSRLTGIFEVRIYPQEYSLSNLLRSSIPDRSRYASGKLLVAEGARRAIDVRKLEAQLRQIDHHAVRQRRNTYVRLYNEARISAEPGRGLSFNAMLMMLAHYKLIDDEKALLVEDLLVRRQKTDRVTDLVNLDRVRGLLRTVYWRRRFLKTRGEKSLGFNPESNIIPEIVLDPSVTTPPQLQYDPFDYGREPHDQEGFDQWKSPVSQSSSPSASPRLASTSPDLRAGTITLSPSLSAAGGVRSAMVRQISDNSMLSSDDAHNVDPRPSEDGDHDHAYMDAASTSVWDEMMREAQEDEET